MALFECPRVMIAGQSSSCGKTLITCGIMRALVNRGKAVSSFKCGPDYIDPMFHEQVVKTKSGNLDSFFLRDNVLRYVFFKTAEGTDISVVEGVMGYYDGQKTTTSEGSSCDISLKLGIPTILVTDCSGASVSCVPVIKGFLEFSENRIAGVILNNMSETIFPEMKKYIESELDVKVVGFLPRIPELDLESRHLGLVLPSEVESLECRLDLLAEKIEKTIDLNLLMEIAGSAGSMEVSEPQIPKLGKKAKIAVARDRAFCFIYPDNIRLMEDMGAEIVFFSPLDDRSLPEGISGLILPGGYPELCAEELASNRSMIADIAEKLKNGLPCLAECGGFMYLHSELEDRDGNAHRMVGAVKGRCFNSGKLSRFGYVSLTSQENDSVLKDLVVKGHEFHYWDSEDNGSCWTAQKTDGKTYRCMHEGGAQIFGFPHLYYFSEPEMLYNFLKKCADR